MRELHLFAGAGGGIHASNLLGHTPVCAVELEPYCRQVLRERQADGTFPPFPVFEDVKTFDGKPWRGIVDIVCGGFPCQPWSSAGKLKGTDDPRHLWPDMKRIIEEVRPKYVFAENVAIKAFAEPWRDLRELGYRVPPALCLSAEDVGAPHRRKRWWLLASDTQRDELRDQQGWGSGAGRRGATVVGDDGEARELPDIDGEGQPALAVDDEAPRVPLASNTDGARLEERQGQCGDARQELPPPVGADWWAVEPDVGRVAHGVADRVQRLKALGNGQVPQTAAQAFRLLVARLNQSPLLD